MSSPPDRAYKAEFYKCRWCQFRGTCHFGEHHDLERNCRTCTWSSPGMDGKWNCHHWKVELDADAQRAGCQSHRFLPKMLDPWKPIDSTEDYVVIYSVPGGAEFVDSGP